MACNGFFRVQSVRYEPTPQADKLIWCPYCGKRNEMKWPMGAEPKILTEAVAKAASKARPWCSVTLRAAYFDSQRLDSSR